MNESSPESLLSGGSSPEAMNMLQRACEYSGAARGGIAVSNLRGRLRTRPASS
jgi:hypothetical protein